MGPESAGGTAKKADVGRDVGFDDVGRATSNGPNLLCSWGASRPHLVECLVVKVGDERRDRTAAPASPQYGPKLINKLRVRVRGLSCTKDNANMLRTM
jgi:hypothetical protein